MMKMVKEEGEAVAEEEVEEEGEKEVVEEEWRVVESDVVARENLKESQEMPALELKLKTNVVVEEKETGVLSRMITRKKKM